jgi:heme exporter protein C
MMRITVAAFKSANLRSFPTIARRVIPWSAAAALLLFAVGLYLSLVVAPADYQQGDSARIMYVHVPTAWMALFTYGFLALCSAIALIWHHPLADISAQAAAPIGAVFTFLALFTGAVWGQPMWGTWWVWDARLTSMLVLFFLYLGYIALVNTFDDPGRGSRVAATLALVGVVNLPIIKFSVEWWNTLHQPSSLFRAEGPAIHPDMLWPLIIMALAFKLYFLTVLLMRICDGIMARRIHSLQVQKTQRGGVMTAPVYDSAQQQ